MKKIKIVHIIAGLDTGGAETMLYRMLTVYEKNAFSPIVISLTDIGNIGLKIKKLGIDVYHCSIKKDFSFFKSLLKLFFILRKEKPDIIQTWMYHADFFGGIAGGILKIPVVWGIHNSTLVKGKSKITTMIIAKINAVLSLILPRKIICCSQIAKKFHEQIGYSIKKMIFIPNGFDANLFQADLNSKRSMRNSFQIGSGDFVIGMAARFDPQKDFTNFIKAAEIFSKRVTNCKFVLCGTDVTSENKILIDLIKNGGLKDKFYLLGQRDDVPSIISMMDIFTLSSLYGEAFPLVIGEAMLCEVPCVVTNVGDSSDLVGNTGITVPVNNAEALSNGWLQMYQIGEKKRRELGIMARHRIQENFDLSQICNQYQNLYNDIFLKKL